MATKTILMLEDDSDRLARFEIVISQIDPEIRLIQWRNAHRMIREAAQYLPSCNLICLDHDLEPEPRESDPGDGLDVARFLAEQRPVCPILIHSSNGDRVRRMVGVFELVDIQSQTILPLGADWIERYWRKRVEGLLVSST